MTDLTNDTATGVHKLAIPRHVTLRATRTPNAIGDGHHYAITGHCPLGEDAFHPDMFIVARSEADSAAEAVRVALARFRAKGW